MIASAVLALLLNLAPQANPSSTGSYAVLDIANEREEITSLSNYIGDELSLRYASDSGFSLVERGQLKKVLKEHGLQATGAIDESTIASLGKFLGATRIITGQYYQLGDNYVAMVRTIDVSTAKVLKMNKVEFPKSSSTQALAQTILIPAPSLAFAPGPIATALATAATASNTSINTLKIETAGRSIYSEILLSGYFIPGEKGKFHFDRESLFITDAGDTAEFSRVDSPNENSIYEKGIEIPIYLRFKKCNGKNFSRIVFKYTYARKDYVVETKVHID